MAPPATPSFIGIAAEVRLNIYRHLFHNITLAIDNECKPNWPDGDQSQILRTCHTFRREASPIFSAAVTSLEVYRPSCLELVQPTYPWEIKQALVSLQSSAWTTAATISERLPALELLVPKDTDVSFDSHDWSDFHAKGFMDRGSGACLAEFGRQYVNQQMPGDLLEAPALPFKLRLFLVPQMKEDSDELFLVSRIARTRELVIDLDSESRLRAQTLEGPMQGASGRR